MLFALLIAVAAERIDPRLAHATKAWIEAHDTLSDDQAIASCIPERLTTLTPITAATTRAEADVILTVSSGSVGKHPKGHLTASLPNGTHLWDGQSKTRGFNLVGRNMTCVIATDLVQNLRKAMRQAREKAVR